MNQTYFEGIWRMDWGLGNANKTAGLIAILMVAIWALRYIKRWGFWVALTIFTVLGICLLHTFSRGGVLAVITGLLILIWRLEKPWPRPYVIGLITAFWVIVFTSLCLHANKRMSQGIIQEDKSISNRLLIWKQAPRMMVDAPEGWGLGQSGQIYGQWYQPVDRSEYYRTLVNSHLTWLVEVSWPLRFAYVMGWLSILVLCFPQKTVDESGICLGVWVAFAIAATFSSVAESFWLWIVPIGALLYVVYRRRSTRKWPSAVVWLITMAVSTFILAIFSYEGKRNNSVFRITQLTPRSIAVGQATPDYWIVYSQRVMGNSFGKTLRTYLLRHPLNVALAFSVADLPRSIQGTVVAGDRLEEPDVATLKNKLGSNAKLILLNPIFTSTKLAEDGGLAPKILVYFGEYADAPDRFFWEMRVHTLTLESRTNYIPEWPELLDQQ